jgi:phosphoribosylglycinamide formyltransferase 1
MKKSFGRKKNRTAVFISGRGSNLKSLIEYSIKKRSPISITVIISNTKKAKGLKYSSKFNIEKKIISFKKKQFAENEVLKFLSKKKINFICLAGFMKILSKNFIKKFKGKIINIHPSLLPKYKGLNTHKKAIENNDKYAGCSVHFVTAKIDSGKIIMQKKVRIKKNDTIYSLSKKVLKKEHLLYPAAIKKIYN